MNLFLACMYWFLIWEALRLDLGEKYFFAHNTFFLPAAKPTGHKTVRVVVVVGGGGLL